MAKAINYPETAKASEKVLAAAADLILSRKAKAEGTRRNGLMYVTLRHDGGYINLTQPDFFEALQRAKQTLTNPK